ncbi:MAG: hypothetical protein ACRD2B_14990, partial [Terriglobia bacterium]
PMLQTANANISSDVTERQAVELPLNLRSVFTLVDLNSSVNNSAETQALVGGGGGNGNTPDQNLFFNFGGARFGTTAFLLDGHWDSTSDWSYILYAPNPDETQEFKVQSNSFTAQYGWSMGNVVNAITKSGTRSFHGDAYEFLRNSAFDSNFFFSNLHGLPKTAFRRNQFGVTAGGPLYIPGVYKQRDKTFFFVAYEGLRQETPGTVITTLPTTAMRGGDFSALLGSQIGTDCLGRPVLAGQIYNPFTTRQVTCNNGQTAFIRDPIAGNIIPSSMFNSVAKNMLPYFPSPTSNSLSNNYVASETNPATTNEYSFRVDHNISDKSRFFLRWSEKRPESTATNIGLYPASDPAGPGAYTSERRYDTGFNYNHVFSPTFVMGANVGWNQNPESTISLQDGGFKPSALGLPAFMDTVAGASFFPEITISNMSGLGSGNQIGTKPRGDWSYSADFTKIQGVHTLEFGFMGIALSYNENLVYPPSFSFPLTMTAGPDPTAPTSNTGFGFASFLLGTGSSGSFPITAEPAMMEHRYGWYVQDDWKATRKLTLNLGFRYDMQTPPTERFNRLVRFLYSAPNPITPYVGFQVPGELQYTTPGDRGVYNTQYTDFAPRISLTYLLHKRLLLRTGFGTFYTPAIEMSDYQGLDLYGFTEDTPYVGTVNGITPLNLLSNPFPSGPLLPTGNSLGGLTNVGQSTDAVEPYRPSPYVEQWTFGLQYQLGLNTSFDATYIGNHGLKLTLYNNGVDTLPSQDLSMGSALFDQVSNPFYRHITASGCGLNQPTVTQSQLLLPFPEFCGVTEVQNPAGSSSYNALEITLMHRWSHSLQFIASFTASKYLDNSAGYEAWAERGAGNIENYYNLANEYSLDGDDIPKSLVLSHIYQLPVGKGKRFGSNFSAPVNAVLGGWEVSGIETFKDGFPLSISTDDNNANSGGGQRPNLVGNPHIANPTIYQWFNTAAFAEPPAFTYGNVGRYMPNLRAPGLNNFDLAIEKNWHPNERFRLQFRAEMYNAFNHPQFYEPNTTLGSPTFGQITATLPPRDIQFGLKAYW